MSKKKQINRLNKQYYVSDEYGHTDEMVVKKINELIGIVNQQQEVINDFAYIMRNMKGKKR